MSTTTTGPECIDNSGCDDGEVCANNVCIVLEPDLCGRLALMPGINQLNADFVSKVLNDQRINGYFLNDDVNGANLIACLNKQIGEAAACPGITYDCLDMLTVHAGMGIGLQDFSDLAEDYSNALNDHQAMNAPELTEDDKNALLGILAVMAPDIVEDETDDATVYQRVGRKPAILSLVGFPGEVGSFVDNIAKDVEINGFFDGSNFERLNTCLTRQIASIDGPIGYGLEVNSPGEGIDIGVALASKCMSMCDAHAGMVDDMNAPVTMTDFTALANNLVTSMTTAGVTDDDQAVILGVLGPMCLEIVSDPGNCPGVPTKPVSVMANGLAMEIPDNGYNGTIASMACATLDVEDPGDEFTLVSNVEIELGMTHPWVGDITVKVVSPDNTVLTVLSRADYAEPSDDGNGCCGDNSNLESSSPIKFANDGDKEGELLGVGIGLNEVVCKDDDECSYSPSPDQGPGVDFDDFAGGSIIGTWRICVGDSVAGDKGVLDSVELKIESSQPVCP